MRLTLPETVASTQDLAAIITEAHDYAKWVSRETIKQKVAGKTSGSAPIISTEALTIIRTWAAGKPVTKPVIDDLVKALDDYRKSAPTMTITLAAIPSGDLKTNLVRWCRTEINPNILITFRLNRAILGGMVIAYGSHIHDWSFRRKLMEPSKPFHEVLAHV
jgi:hypothetical protein